LYLDYNDFSGTLTNDFASYTFLENLDLTRNSLDGDMGDILSGLAPDIEVVFLGRNSITGTLSTDFSGFTHLRDLSLERNNLSGNLESIFGNMPSTLEYIAMNNNSFTGTVPAGASVFSSLTHLDLSVNNLSGQLETAIGNLPPGNLEFLDLGSNEFHGKIPSGISNISQLHDFSVSYSPLIEGTIPLSITSLPLTRFDFRETYLCEPTTSAYASWKAGVSEYLPGYLPTGICSILGAFNGAAEIISDQRVVAIGRPHIGSEIMAYNGFNSGATIVYLPMLFNGKWNYASTFTVQNAGTGNATYDLIFKDAADGSTSCEISEESLPVHGVKTYDVTNLGACDSGNLPVDWFGGATISSDEPLAVVAKPDINGTDAVTYNGFTGGDYTTYLPMLFRGKYGYQSAFYVQNLDSSDDAILSIEFYDADGNFTCTYEDLSPIGPSVTRGYWMGAITSADCEIGDPGFVDPTGWAGSAVVNITGGGSNEIVAIGRPHLGAEVAAYNGFIAGDTTNYLPMLFRGQWGYDSAFYIQNISQFEAEISVDFYDVDGNFTCTYDDPVPLPSNATRGYWTPALDCNAGGNFPGSGWAGSAEISSSEDVIAVGRPHLSSGQVVVYNAFTRGDREGFIPMTFRKWNGSETALYIQNLDGSEDANVTVTFYDEEDGFYCQMEQVVAPGSAGAIWLAALDPLTCDPIP
jgi:hypothetical protein